MLSGDDSVAMEVELERNKLAIHFRIIGKKNLILFSFLKLDRTFFFVWITVIEIISSSYDHCFRTLLYVCVAIEVSHV